VLDIGLVSASIFGLTAFLDLWASIPMICDVVGGLAFGWLPGVILALLPSDSTPAVNRPFHRFNHASGSL
jgi:hypothetical protein